MSSSGTAVPPPTTVFRLDRSTGEPPDARSWTTRSRSIHTVGTPPDPGHAVLGDQLGHRVGGEARSRQDHVGTRETANERQPPPHGMKERNQPEDNVLLTDPEDVTTCHRQCMQDDRPVGVQHPLRVPRRTRRVAEPRSSPLVDVDRRHRLAHLRDQVLETDLARSEVTAVSPDDHDMLKVRQPMPQPIDLGSEFGLNDQHGVPRVVDRVHQLVLVQPQVGGVQDRTHAHDRVVDLEVFLGVPRQTADPIPRVHSQLRQPRRQALRTIQHLTEGGRPRGPIGAAAPTLRPPATRDGRHASCVATARRSGRHPS